MKACVDEAMACGAWGLSTGRDYPPSAYADPAEIIELMRHAGRHGGHVFHPLEAHGRAGRYAGKAQ